MFDSGFQPHRTGPEMRDRCWKCLGLGQLGRPLFRYAQPACQFLDPNQGGEIGLIELTVESFLINRADASNPAPLDASLVRSRYDGRRRTIDCLDGFVAVYPYLYVEVSVSDPDGRRELFQKVQKVFKGI